MFRSLILLSAVAFLAACGDDPAPPQAPAAAPAPAQSGAAETAAAPAASMPAAMDEEEIKYDPIDVSKLESRWWKQYSNDG